MGLIAKKRYKTSIMFLLMLVAGVCCYFFLTQSNIKGNDYIKLEDSVGLCLPDYRLNNPLKEETLAQIKTTYSKKKLETSDNTNNSNQDEPSANTPVIATNITLDYIQGKFTPSSHKDFIKISSTYANSSSFYLRKDTYEAFKNMHTAAKKDGVNLKIISATRNFYSQKSIWEAKWTGSRLLGSGENAATTYPDPTERALKILEYSSMPGTSRHHWGTDIDLNSLTNSYFSSGEGLKIYNWLKKNASAYGFCQPYTAKGSSRPTGYNEEKWHWSYKPVSKTITEKTKSQLTDNKISGFKGSETAVEIGVVENYVLGIDSSCL